MTTLCECLERVEHNTRVTNRCRAEVDLAKEFLLSDIGLQFTFCTAHQGIPSSWFEARERIGAGVIIGQMVDSYWIEGEIMRWLLIEQATDRSAISPALLKRLRGLAERLSLMEYYDLAETERGAEGC